MGRNLACSPQTNFLSHDFIYYCLFKTVLSRLSPESSRSQLVNTLVNPNVESRLRPSHAPLATVFKT